MTRTFLTVLILAVSAIAQTGGVPGQAKPIKADQIAGNDGTLLRVLKTDTAGQLFVVMPTGTSANQIQGTNATGTPPVGNPLMVGWDGTNSRLLKTDSAGDLATVAAVADADGIANNPAGQTVSPSGTSGPLEINNHIFNGATWDRQRSASSTNYPASTTLTARNSIGVQLAEKGSRWAVNSAPAAGTVASASIALEAGVKHVLDTVCFSSGSAVAPVLTSLQVNIRDGATGAGTVLMSFEVEIPAATGQDTPPICISGLNLVGTAGTAMTVEWSAGLANLKQTATAIGYNVN
jgi:hypothetical protein